MGEVIKSGYGPSVENRVLDEEKHAGPEDTRWWLLDEEKIGPAMVRVADKYAMAQSDRREASRRYTQLHRGKIAENMHDSGRASTLAEDLYMSWNVVQAAQNTAASVITRSKVRIMVQTDGADWELQDHAELGELFVAGVFRGNKVYEKIDPIIFFDAGIPGLGVTLTRPHPKTGEPIIERVVPDELVYPESEAACGRIRQWFRVRWMSKWEAAEQFGDTEEKLKAIAACGTYNAPMVGTPGLTIPLIPVWRGFFIPDEEAKEGAEGLESTTGREVFAIPQFTLSVAPYRWTREPFSAMRVEQTPVGYWGIGVAERLAGFQYRINEINDDILEAGRMGSVGKWLVDTGANVNDDEFTDEQGGIVHYSKTAPKWERNEGIPQTLLNERQECYIQSFKELGLSEWSVAGVQPKNGDSGEYLDGLKEKEEGRAIPCGNNWETFHVDLAECVLMAAADGARINPDLAASANDEKGDGLTQVKFQQIARLLTSKTARVLMPYPTSILPQSPQAKFEKVKEWEQKGWIDSATAAALSEQPDTHQESSLQLAGIKAVRWALTQIIRKGPKAYEPPDPSMPLELGFRLAQGVYLKGLRQGMPEDRLEKIASFRDECMRLAKAQGPTPTAATPGQAAPGAPVAPVNAPPPVEGGPPGGAPPEMAPAAGPPGAPAAAEMMV